MCYSYLHRYISLAAALGVERPSGCPLLSLKSETQIFNISKRGPHKSNQESFFRGKTKKVSIPSQYFVSWLGLKDETNKKRVAHLPPNWTLILQMKELRFAAAAAKSLQSCPTLCDPMDSSPPGSPVPGILQARTLEWVAISFSSA